MTDQPTSPSDLSNDDLVNEISDTYTFLSETLAESTNAGYSRFDAMQEPGNQRTRARLDALEAEQAKRLAGARLMMRQFSDEALDYDALHGDLLTRFVAREIKAGREDDAREAQREDSLPF